MRPRPAMATGHLSRSETALWERNIERKRVFVICITLLKELQQAAEKLPLPLGEGWGEGLRRASTQYLFSFFALSPHPNPLPKGEGMVFQQPARVAQEHPQKPR